MVTKKRGLGRGLEALLPKKEEVAPPKDRSRRDSNRIHSARQVSAKGLFCRGIHCRAQRLDKSPGYHPAYCA